MADRLRKAGSGRGNLPVKRKIPSQYSAIRNGIVVSFALCSSTWKRSPAADPPKRSARTFWIFGSSASSQLTMVAPPVSSRIVIAGELRSSSFSAAC
jgi:hypothetical protein